MQTFIAHIREKDKKTQSLEEHLLNVSKLSARNARKFKMEEFGELLGLLHDVGKYSESFQRYIRSSGGLFDQDVDDTNASAVHTTGASGSSLRGKIDHSTSGAQIAWSYLTTSGHNELAQFAALLLASHHSGLIDCIEPCGEDVFSKRMKKPNDLTHLEEVKGKIPKGLWKQIEELSSKIGASRTLRDILKKEWKRLASSSLGDRGKRRICFFTAGLLARMLFSCLIDADRADTIGFERKNIPVDLSANLYPEWRSLIDKLESHLEELSKNDPFADDSVSEGRRFVSKCCRCASSRERGLFTLTVPTGGGKTLASLLFAMHHAEKNHLDRIFYIVPYTTIIDQNAEVVRKILAPGGETERIVLECHSNLSSERESWLGKILSETWDAPIVFTTSVQFFEAFFSGGTRNVRKMHQLANSMIIFDEVQTVPIKMVHLFCNAVNFLLFHCKSSIMLCTATQPLLSNVEKEKGALDYNERNEIIRGVPKLFETFKRVDFFYEPKPGGHRNEEIAELALGECERSGSCLVVTNTTKSAKDIFRMIQSRFGNTLHLSAKMCPAHRAEVFKRLKVFLAGEKNSPVICVSTQVIEAGVDIDFGSVVRFIAGLDSVAQAAGRCNRHGRRKSGRVVLVDSAEERLNRLPDIADGKEQTLRIIGEYLKTCPEARLGDYLLTPEAMTRFYEYYYYRKKEEMSYRVSGVRDDTLLNMLSDNGKGVYEYSKKEGKKPPLILPQSFSSAAKEFKAIDAPTRAVIVPYKKGEEIVAILCSEQSVGESTSTLRRAQRYSVNIYPHEFELLLEKGAIYEIGVEKDREGVGLWALQSGYYSADFGICMEGDGISGAKGEIC